jgi:hypothetical protein
MPKTIDIRCDECNKRLNDDRHAHHMIALTNHALPHVKGLPVPAVIRYPIFSKDAYFCSKGCLLDWLHQKD